VDPEIFLQTDGARPFLDSDAHYENVFVARAAWEVDRAEVWAHPWRDLWPPRAAVVYDHIGETTRSRRPGRPFPEYAWDDRKKRFGPVSDPIVWTPERVAEAVESDVASVEAFRLAKPAAAKEIDAELAVYLTDLRMLLSIAEQHGAELDEMDCPHVAAAAWSHFESGRRAKL